MTQLNFDHSKGGELPIVKPRIAEKPFRTVKGNLSNLKTTNSFPEDIQAELNSYLNNKLKKAIYVKKDNNYEGDKGIENKSELDDSSKTESITQECLSYIHHVRGSLNFLMAIKEELEREEVGDDSSSTHGLAYTFRDIQSLKLAYEMIRETIERLESNNPKSFYLYEVVLDPVVSNLLKVYKPFITNYGDIIKWMTEFNKDNENVDVVFDRVRKNSEDMEYVNLNMCLYTVFNSLFSIELMFERYRKEFDESSYQFRKATEAKELISNILKTVNQNQDQESFILTQKELSFLRGSSRESRVTTRFVYKGVVIKSSRKHEKRLPRQLVLFTDCLYVTMLPGNLRGTSSVRQELSVDSMKLSGFFSPSLSLSTNTDWGLTITAKEAVLDIFFDSEPTMNLWRDKLLDVISAQNRLANIDRVSAKSDSLLDSLGLEAPRWQKDNAVGFCNGHGCSLKFSTSIRKHHCRADGLIYCDSCCNFKIKLEFERSLESRVCELCYNILYLHRDDEEQVAKARSQLQQVMYRKTHTGRKTGWLKVKAFNKERVVFLPMVRYYCDLEWEYLVLKFYERQEDKYHFDKVDLSEIAIVDEMPSSHFIIEDHTKTPLYHVTAPSTEDCQSWLALLKEGIERCAWY